MQEVKDDSQQVAVAHDHSDLLIHLTRYIADPQNAANAQQLGLALQRATFLITADASGQATLTTYLADGRAYLPAYTDNQILEHTLQLQRLPQLLQVRELPTAGAMQLAQTLGGRGLLVNPTVDSFPLPLDYWHQLQQVETVLVVPLPMPKAQLTAALTAHAKQLAQVLAIWTSGIQQKESQAVGVAIQFSTPEVNAVKADAQRLLDATLKVVPKAIAVVVTPHTSELGQAIVNAGAPIYQFTPATTVDQSVS